MMEKDPENFEQNIKPISELRSYNKLLEEVSPQNPVILTKNGCGKYALMDISDFKKFQESIFAAKMMKVADEARRGKKYSWDDVKKELES